jgi:hypothetical protein
LASKAIEIDSEVYSVTTRLALYQDGRTANASMDSSSDFGVPAKIGYGIVGLSIDDLVSSTRRFGMPIPSFLNDCDIARGYYESCLQGTPQSPCGVLAAPVLADLHVAPPDNQHTHQKIERVLASVVLPWEFEFIKWIEQCSPLDALADSVPGVIGSPFDRVESIASAVGEQMVFPDYEAGNSETDPSLEFRLQAELALKRSGRQLHLIII